MSKGWDAQVSGSGFVGLAVVGILVLLLSRIAAGHPGYSLAVFKRWRKWVAGSVLFFLIGLGTGFGMSAPTRWALAAAVLSGLFIAQFQVWEAQREKLRRSRRDCKKVKRELRELRSAEGYRPGKNQPTTIAQPMIVFPDADQFAALQSLIGATTMGENAMVTTDAASSESSDGSGP